MLRVPVATLAAGELRLDERAARYVARVHRCRAGDRVLLFDGARALEAEARIARIEGDAVVCDVEPPRPCAVRAPREVVLLQGLGKGDKVDAVVRDATELGATRVVVVATERTVVRLGDRGAARLERWRRIAGEAARQCGRGDPPFVEGPVAWEAALAGVPEGACKLCFWERAVDPAGPHLLGAAPDRAMALAVGPEGGLSEREVEAAERRGFAPVSLGPSVLRTETVAAAVLGALLVLR